MEDDIDWTVRKRKPKPVVSSPVTEPMPPMEPDYTYEELLRMGYAKMEASDQPTPIPAPILGKDGGKITVVKNFKDICDVIGRHTEMVMLFLNIETGGKVSLAGDGGTMLRLWGKYRQSQIERMLSKFIIGYVKCSACGNMDTATTKNQGLMMVTCKCGNSRAVALLRGRKPQQRDSH